MKSKLLILISLFYCANSFAQSNLLNAKTPDKINVKTEQQIKKDNDKPLEYGYVDDRDLLWGKTIWEEIDLGERINFPYYYPIDTLIGSHRRSLYDVIIKNIKSGAITQVYGDSYFTEKRTLKDIESALTKVDTSDLGIEQLNAGEEISQEYIIKTDMNASFVTGYKIKGIWYFDKRQGELKYRILGLCPVVPDIFTLESEEKDYIELFWIFYPNVRTILHEAKAFNPNNSASAFSFDHLFNARRFNAVIYKEENLVGDREIKDYVKDHSLMQLLESERIREVIRDFEQDMWNY